MTGKYSGATILEQRERLTLISLNGNDFWIRNEVLFPEPKPESKPKPKSEPKSKQEAKRANVSAGVKRYWRDRKGHKDVSEPRARDL
jgi:hypothetical protein